MSAYATPADMINAFDASILGDVVSDTGVQIDESGLADNPKLLSALLRASGEVEAAVIAGGMYTPAELAALSGNGQALLVEVVCCVAMCKLLRRRPSTRTEELQKGVCGDAKDLLQALRKGDAVFGGSANATDGTLPETTGPTSATFANLNMTVDQTKNYYPRRRLPYGR